MLRCFLTCTILYISSGACKGVDFILKLGHIFVCHKFRNSIYLTSGVDDVMMLRRITCQP